MHINDFTHLHLHTQYSFLDGAIRISDLIPKLQELNMKQVAITDHGHMFGALDFYIQTTKAGIKPIIGIEAYITGNARYTEKVRENFHIILLAENNIGLKNLKQLISKAFLYGKYYLPRIDKSLLFEHKEGLIALSACLGGEVAKKFIEESPDASIKAIQDFKQIFGPKHFYLEIQPNGLPEQVKLNSFLAEVAIAEKLNLVATNDCHYIHKDGYEAQNVLMAIRQRSSIYNPSMHTHKSTAFYLRSGQEMWDLLKDEFPSAFENTFEISQRCNVSLNLNLELSTQYFQLPILASNGFDKLKNAIYEGLKNRLREIFSPNFYNYIQRLNNEINSIQSLGFVNYFLIVQEFINWARKKKIRVGPGRGSGAGSLVAFVLRITNIDPIFHKLLFERFLNSERVSMPDFDIDFMQKRRSEVIRHVCAKYGREHVAQIATFSSLNAKSLVKDVARAVSIPFNEINELTKSVPSMIEGHKISFKNFLIHSPHIENRAKTLHQYQTLLSTAPILEGLLRQAGIHAAGVVISQKSLLEYSSLSKGPHQEIFIQCDKNMLDVSGLVKFDLLGLKTLDLLSIAENLINKRLKRQNLPPFSVEILSPYSKESFPVYKLIASGDTYGIFQFESPGFQELCRKLKPNQFEHIVAATALYRPGPIQAGMTKNFIERKLGIRNTVYPHPLLQTLLKETFGTFVYQEQILIAAQTLAGYSLGAADLLRQAMSKKQSTEMEQQRSDFVSGCLRLNNISDKIANSIFDSIREFARYGFNKSHATAYSWITYQTAYLKYYYPIEFLTALLSTSIDSSVDMSKYIRDARSACINILPPNINKSLRSFSLENQDIRFGLNAIKGIGTIALNVIIKARIIYKQFLNLFDFCEKVSLNKINKKIIEVLVKSGSMDIFGPSRKQMYLAIPNAITSARRTQKDLKNKNPYLLKDMNLFNLEKYENCDEWEAREKRKFEQLTLGMFLASHPLIKYKNDNQLLNVISTKEIPFRRKFSHIQIIGMVSEIKELFNKKKEKWALLTIEDLYGSTQMFVYNQEYKQFRRYLRFPEPIIIKAQFLRKRKFEQNFLTIPKLKLINVEFACNIKEEKTKFVQIMFPSSNFDTIKAFQLCKKYKGNKQIKLTFIIDQNSFIYYPCLKLKVNTNDDFFISINHSKGFIGVSRDYL
ncbi:MAG: DNA polymerase III subunit alpha [Deltaproteobacteria bacterium]|nr:MAG: DNA polymerase III subunit alpha [Deltaproteobacteria bacterium]